MAHVITAGMTGAQFIAALNIKNTFNVLDYGAVGNDSTDNTTILQAVIELAHVAGGTVYFPGGTYKTGKLTTYYDVKILGDGPASVIKGINATAILEFKWLTIPMAMGHGGVENIRLDGDGVATYGYYAQVMDNFHIRNLEIINVAGTGLYCHGSIGGSFDGCLFWNNEIGVDCDNGGMTPNLLTFKNCMWSTNSIYALRMNNAQLLKISSSDIERNGTQDNPATGAIQYNLVTLVSSDQNFGLILENNWFEDNRGYVVDLTDPCVNIRHIISDNIFIGNEGDCITNLHIVGTTYQNTVLFRGNMSKDGANAIVDGANAKLINDHSFMKGADLSNTQYLYGYGAVTLQNGAQYIYERDWWGHVRAPQVIGAITDDAPTDAELDSIIGFTPAAAGAGWQCTIKDSSGSGLLYKVESDGTSWFYAKLTAAV